MISSALQFTLSLLALNLATRALAAPATPVVDHSTGRSGYVDDPTALCNGILPGAGSAVTYPLRGSCTRYLRCGILGDPVLHSCPIGLQYNRMSGQCDDPANVGCKEKRDLYRYDHRQHKNDTGFIVDGDEDQLHEETKTDGDQTHLRSRH
ncbi:hypothetical protein BCR43DRAFT_547499 [Syncephalastrum racemosum]|uniref:Chitin-binding type-2 domain-containing protein n=1 Tax=Syncephalastrum racemosum TaxID=13706 RepID=A0A1X2HC43_SYNRA|nr:hypothetical protein BCR43DRAFT_547499 [Syncephalastrum racemosum]